MVTNSATYTIGVTIYQIYKSEPLETEQSEWSFERCSGSRALNGDCIQSRQREGAWEVCMDGDGMQDNGCFTAQKQVIVECDQAGTDCIDFEKSSYIITDLIIPPPNKTRVEYIIAVWLYHVLPPKEHRHWHSHNYQVKENFWVNIRVVEVLQMTELHDLTRSYGKFWCTWQWDNGDAITLGVPSAGVRLPPATDQETEGRRKERFVTYIRRVKGEARNSTTP